MNDSSHAYRPEIDGLRAFAILPVVFYHAGLGCPGGFIGVDVFFVISGFLIGGILLRESDSGAFSFAKFWERRVRRIVPAILFFLAVTLFAGWRILPPPDFSSLASQTLYALGCAANFKMLALTGGYWAAPANSVLLLHTWSLAVEEQFYLLMPVILALAYRWFRRGVPWLLLTLLAASLAQSFYWSADVNPANFFLLPSRAWELLLGCLGAWALKENLVLPRSLAPLATALGLILLLLSTFLIHLDDKWPDLRALAPAFGALLILITPGASLPVKFLQLAPLRFFGLISYSLYLWHWPMVVILREFGPDQIGLADRLLLVAASVCLATLSCRFVEQPFRNKFPSRRVPTKSLLIISLTAWLALIAVSAAILHTPAGKLASLSSVPQLFDSPGDESIQKYDTAESFASGGLQLNSRYGSPQCVLLGSSHGMALGPVIEALSDQYHLPTAVLSRGSAISPLFSGYHMTTNVPRKLREHRLQEEAVKKHLTLWRPKLIFLAARWDDEYDNRLSTPAPSPVSFAIEASNTLAWLSAHADRVLVVGQVPQLPFPDRTDARLEILRRYHSQHDTMPRLLELPAITAKRHHALQILQNCAPSNVLILDPDQFLHNPNGSLRYYDTNGLFYFDKHHLNSLGSLQLEPLLAPFFRNIQN